MGPVNTVCWVILSARRVNVNQIVIVGVCQSVDPPDAVVPEDCISFNSGEVRLDWTSGPYGMQEAFEVQR